MIRRCGALSMPCSCAPHNDGWTPMAVAHALATRTHALLLAKMKTISRHTVLPKEAQSCCEPASDKRLTCREWPPACQHGQEQSPIYLPQWPDAALLEARADVTSKDTTCPSSDVTSQLRLPVAASAQIWNSCKALQVCCHWLPCSESFFAMIA